MTAFYQPPLTITGARPQEQLTLQAHG
jgi:hypothetical protein